MAALKRRISKGHAKARAEALSGRGKPAKTIDTAPKMFVSSPTERMLVWIFVALFLFMCVIEIGMQWRDVTIAPEGIGGYRTLYTIHFYATILFLVALLLFALPRLPFALAWHDYDSEYIRKWGGFLRKYSPVPPAGKYNGFQKLYTVAILLVGALYGLTGIVVHSVRILEPQLIRLSFNLHFGAFVVMVFITAIYVYLMYVATPGRFTILTKGYLTVKFLQIHHSVWYERLKEKPLTAEEEHRRVVEMLHHKDMKRALQMKKQAEEAATSEVVDMEVVEENEGGEVEEVAVEVDSEEVGEVDVEIEGREEGEVEGEVEGEQQEEQEEEIEEVEEKGIEEEKVEGETTEEEKEGEQQ